MAIRTRPPVLEDVATLADMVDQAWRTTYADVFPAEFWRHDTVTQRADELAASIIDLSQRGLLAEDDGTVVGWALSGPSRASTAGLMASRGTELYSLYARRPGAGLGQTLLDELLEGQPAELWVFEANTQAQRFYARNGFRPDGSRHVYCPESVGVPEVRLVR